MQNDKNCMLALFTLNDFAVVNWLLLVLLDAREVTPIRNALMGGMVIPVTSHVLAK